MSNNEYEDQYSEENFWNKIVSFAKQAGKDVVEKALQLFFAAQHPETPVWAKTAIYGALGYFISPIDAIPDIVPVVGYSDDLGVLALALATVSIYITDEVKTTASKKIEVWFN
jgi:uncharacterized membrane protein YkvA (DUF1232 family)